MAKKDEQTEKRGWVLDMGAEFESVRLNLKTL